MRIPLAANLESRDGGVGKDAKVVNGLVESRGQDVPPVLLKRSGISDVGQVGAGKGQLLAVWNGILTIVGDALRGGTPTTIVSNLAFPTLNAGDKGANITLSNGNLTATGGVAFASVRGTQGKSSGKWYWEVMVPPSNLGNIVAGVGNSSATLTSYCGKDTNGWSIEASTGKGLHNDIETAALTTAFNANEIVGFALDMGAGTLNLYRSGALAATVASSLTGTIFPMVSAISSTAITVNFGATTFAWPIPAGCSAMFSSIPLAPTNGALSFTAAATNDNATTPRLMFKNRTQAWVINRASSVTSVTFGGSMGSQTYNLLSLTRTSATATGTLADNVFNIGDSVTIAGAAQTDYNGTFTVTAQTLAVPSITVALTITRSGSTATAVTTNGQPHGLTNGASYAISGATQSAYNGTYTVTVTNSTTFTFTITVTSYSAITGTWNPSDKDSSVTLSNGNLTASINAGVSTRGAVRGTVSKSSGKWAWEITVNNAQFSVIGIATSSMPLTDFVGQDVNSWGYSSGAFFHNNVQTSGIATFTSGDVIGIRVDLDAGVVTFFKNGVSIGSVSGVTGTVFPAISNTGNIAAVTTANFSGPFTYDYGDPATTATGTPIVTIPAVNATFSYTVANSPTTPATGTITAQSNGGMVPGIPYIDGYFFVMDTAGVMWASNQDDPTTWGALAFLTARNENGAGRGLVKSLNYLVAFKEWSSEFFFDAQNATGFPFSPVDNGFTRTGCATGDSIAQVGDNILWLSQIKQAGRSVHMMTGLQQQKVSTPDIERVLNADSLATVYAMGLNIRGHPLYVLTLVGSNLTLVYDLSTQFWTQWSSLTINSTSVSVASITLSGTTATVTTSTAHGLNDGDPVNISGAGQTAYNGIFQALVVSSTVFTIQVSGNPVTPATGTITMLGYTESYFKYVQAANYNNATYLLHETDGNLYQMVPTLYQDNSQPINVFTRSAKVDGGSDDRKKLGKVRFIGDLVSNVATVRFSDDDCTTFTAARLLQLSQQPAEINKCGSFRRRSIEFRHVGNTPLRAEALELEVAQ